MADKSSTRPSSSRQSPASRPEPGRRLGRPRRPLLRGRRRGRQGHQGLDPGLDLVRAHAPLRRTGRNPQTGANQDPRGQRREGHRRLQAQGCRQVAPTSSKGRREAGSARARPSASAADAARRAHASPGAAPPGRSAPAVLLARGVRRDALRRSRSAAAPPPAHRRADPGPSCATGLPSLKLLVNLGAAGMLGALVLAVFALEPEASRSSDARSMSPPRSPPCSPSRPPAPGSSPSCLDRPDPRRARDRVRRRPRAVPHDHRARAGLADSRPSSRPRVTVLCFAVRNQTALAFVTVLAAVGLVPIWPQGTAAARRATTPRSSAIFLHIVFAGVWLGGLLAIVVLRPLLDARRGWSWCCRRYSTVALICFIVVAASGYLERGHPRRRRSRTCSRPYGVLVLVKVAALLALGLFGRLHRRCVIGRIDGRSAARLVLVAGRRRARASWASPPGVAAALARTATPAVEIAAPTSTRRRPPRCSPARRCRRGPTFERYLTLWNFDLLWLLVCAFGIFFYLAGVWRLRKRGDRWPLYRTVLWVAGMLLLFYITNGGVNVYEKYLFSAHMLAHMVLGMMVPVLLVPGAPITLALRAIRKRTDGSRGGREWILLRRALAGVRGARQPDRRGGAVRRVALGVLLLAAVRLGDHDHVGHEWMIVHFLGTGYLFVQSLIGIDPSPTGAVPAAAAHPARHDGVPRVLRPRAHERHRAAARRLVRRDGLGHDALDDQQVGGGIAWSVGEIPTVDLAIIVAIQWARDDAREREALRPQGRPRRRRRARGVQRDARRARPRYGVVRRPGSSRSIRHERHLVGDANGTSSSRVEIEPSNSDCTSTTMCAIAGRRSAPARSPTSPAARA